MYVNDDTFIVAIGAQISGLDNFDRVRWSHMVVAIIMGDEKMSMRHIGG